MLFKIVIALALVMAMYFQINNTGHIGSLWAELIASFSWSRSIFLLFTFLLLPLNWFLETSKWHLLISKFYNITKIDSLKSILVGITFGISTPSRVGEYGGRMVFLPSMYNARSIMVTFVNSFAQNLITYTLGFIGLVYFIRYFQPEQFLLTGIVSIIFVLALAILYLLYFNLDFLLFIKNKIKWLDKKWIKDIFSFDQISGGDLRRTWLLSLLRYGVYLTQYVLVLSFLGVDVDGLIFLSGIAFIFLLQGSIPLPPFLGFVARGEIALIIWGYFDINELVILGTTYLLLCINLLVPAIIGYILVLNVNLLKTFGVKDLSE